MTEPDDKAEAAARELRKVEDPGHWFGVQIGQRWYSRRPGKTSRPHYVTDLVERGGGAKQVAFCDESGKPRGSISLRAWVECYEHR